MMKEPAQPNLQRGITYGGLSRLLAQASIDHLILNPVAREGFFRDTVVEVPEDKLGEVKEIVSMHFGEPFSTERGLVYFGHHTFHPKLILPPELNGATRDGGHRYLERITVRGYSE